MDQVLSQLEQQVTEVHARQKLCKAWAELQQRNLHTLCLAVQRLAPKLRTILVSKQSVGETLRKLAAQEDATEASLLYYVNVEPLSEHLRTLEGRLLNIQTTVDFTQEITDGATAGLLTFIHRWLKKSSEIAESIQPGSVAAVSSDDNGETQEVFQRCRQALFLLSELVRQLPDSLQSRSLRPQLRALLVHIENLTDLAEGVFAQYFPQISVDDLLTLVKEVKLLASIQ